MLVYELELVLSVSVCNNKKDLGGLTNLSAQSLTSKLLFNVQSLLTLQNFVCVNN